MTHDDKRHGTIDVFAALNVGTGEVHTRRHKGHTGADVLAFFEQIDATVPRPGPVGPRDPGQPVRTHRCGGDHVVDSAAHR